MGSACVCQERVRGFEERHTLRFPKPGLELGVEAFLEFLDSSEQISRQPLWNAWQSADLPEYVRPQDVAETIHNWLSALYSAERSTHNAKDIKRLCEELHTRYTSAVRVYNASDGRVLLKDEFIEQFIQYSLYPNPALHPRIDVIVSRVVSHWLCTDESVEDSSLFERWEGIAACKPRPSGLLIAIISDYYESAVELKYFGDIQLRDLAKFVRSTVKSTVLTKLWTTCFELDDDSSVDIKSIAEVIPFLGVFYNRMAVKNNPTIACKKLSEMRKMLWPVTEWIARYKLPFKREITREEFTKVMSAWLVECDDCVVLSAAAFQKAIGISMDAVMHVWNTHVTDRDNYWRMAVANTGKVFNEGSVIVLLYLLLATAHVNRRSLLPDKMKTNRDFKKGFKSLTQCIRNELKVPKLGKLVVDRDTVEENWDKWVAVWRRTLL